jgi:hypothetical protein
MNHLEIKELDTPTFVVIGEKPTLKLASHQYPHLLNNPVMKFNLLTYHNFMQKRTQEILNTISTLPAILKKYQYVNLTNHYIVQAYKRQLEETEIYVTPEDFEDIDRLNRLIGNSEVMFNTIERNIKYYIHKGAYNT